MEKKHQSHTQFNNTIATSHTQFNIIIAQYEKGFLQLFHT